MIRRKKTKEFKDKENWKPNKWTALERKWKKMWDEKYAMSECRREILNNMENLEKVRRKWRTDWKVRAA